MYQHDSHENMKVFIVMSAHIIARPIVSLIGNVNPRHQYEPVMQT